MSAVSTTTPVRPTPAGPFPRAVLVDDRRRSVVPAVRLLGAAAGAALLGLLAAEVGVRLGTLALVGATLGVVLVSLAARRPELMVVVMALVLPVGPRVVGPLELVQVGLVLVVVVVLAQAALRRGVVLPSPAIALPLVAFLLCGALATPGALIADAAFRLDVQLVLLVLLVVTMTTALTTRARLHVATEALLVAGGATAAWALLSSGPAETFYGGAVISGRATGVFSQPNELGLFAAVLFVLAVGVGSAAPRRRTRLVSLVSGLLLLAALSMSLSRGAWLGAVVGLLVLLVVSPAARRPIGALVAAGAAALVVMQLVGVGVGGAVTARISSVLQASDNPYDQRDQIWAEALRQIGERPVTGQGPGGYPEAARHLAASGLPLEAEHAHNLWLSTAAEYGVPGLLALLALMAGLLVAGFQARAALRRAGSRREGGVPMACVAALVAVCVHGVVDYPLRNATVITTVWLVVGLLAAWHLVARRERPAATAARATPATPARPAETETVG